MILNYEKLPYLVKVLDSMVLYVTPSQYLDELFIISFFV